jgi:universal stress protein A
MIVLIATDFSEAAEAAEAQGLDLARRLGAEVVYVHVGTEPSLYGESPFGLVRVQAVYEAQREWATGQLADRVQRAAAGGVVARSVLPTGVPYQEIVKAADKERADMVVIGTHGRTGLQRVLLGSVAERVVRLAPCPVLTVRPRNGR